jgi:putative endonuclease
MYIVYIIYSEKINRYYTGSTNDIKRRLDEHNRKKGKYTDTGIPWRLVYTEEFFKSDEASAREKAIKGKKSRKYIENLVRDR